jgi:serine/threonine protein phosphatase PrpC
MRAVLWGVDHVELGEIVTSSTGGAAVALSRGAFAKTYAYVDANEDAVAVVQGPRATLLVAADGHNGSTAAMRATQFVLDRLGTDPPPGLDKRAWADLFWDANDAVLAVTSIGSAQPSSRTVLLVALAAGRSVSWGSMGDAALVVARPGGERGRQLNKEAARYVGYASSRKGIESSVHRGEAALAPDEWVVLATDGLSEFVSPMKPADVVPRVLARAAGDPEEAAALLVEAACTAGAGDNVGIAVLAPRGG